MSGCVSGWASEWLAGEQAIEGVGKSEWSGWLGKGEWHRQFFSFGQVDWSTDGHVVETKVFFFFMATSTPRWSSAASLRNHTAS